jgi:tetratricopeptide (TPR) repeat protein
MADSDIRGSRSCRSLAVIGGIIKLIRKKKDPTTTQTKIRQKGPCNTAAVIDGDKNIVAGGNVTTGIDGDSALDTLVKVSKEAGQSENEIKHLQERNTELKETIRQLEEQLSQPQIIADTGRQQVPQPTQQAKDLAAQIEDDSGPYALALKAIAVGNTKQAGELLDKTQKLLDKVQEQKDRAQAKIYMARMQNASYAGRPQDALQYCDKLTTLAGNDSLIMNEMAVVYYENAKYKEAEPLMQRALKIDEASLGKDHPNVARDLNNLAQLYQATNRLKEAEPLMQRALKIDEASLGKDHPKVARDLNNLAQLYKATNRLKEAEPLMQRLLVILLQFTRRTGHPHPHLEDAINNYTGLLMQMGHSKDEIGARLKRLAPEMFQ